MVDVSQISSETSAVQHALMMQSMSVEKSARESVCRIYFFRRVENGPFTTPGSTMMETTVEALVQIMTELISSTGLAFLPPLSTLAAQSLLPPMGEKIASTISRFFGYV